MATFRMKEAFNLVNAGMRLMQVNEIYGTEAEAQITELRMFAKLGACEEMLPKKPEVAKPEEKTVDANDDITLVKGVGAGVAKKLADKGITTKSALKAALADKSRTEELKEVLGTQYTKISEQFTKAE